MWRRWTSAGVRVAMQLGERWLTRRFGGFRATVVGAAREGTALARTLAQCGATVTLSDTKRPEALTRYLDKVSDTDVRLALGPDQPPDLLDVDVISLSPGVPPRVAVVERARALGLPISSEPRLFTQLCSEGCSAPIVGITGSSGKSTTTALTGEMYAAAGQSAWVGGNIGQPLIEKLLIGECPDVVVMELSSFQLELFSPDYQGDTVEKRRSDASRVVSLAGWSPAIAAITNITPNHLDRHPSMDDYVSCKANILLFQKAGDWAVLNRDDEMCRQLQARTSAQVLQFSLRDPVGSGAFLRGDELVLRQGRERVLCRTGDLLLRGRHNVANVLTASCCAMAAGVPLEAIRRAATSFRGLPHRLEPVRRWRDILFVNDSIATSPERAIAALNAYTEPLVLLAGGRDKHLPWDRWADLVLRRARVVIAFGELTSIMAAALDEAQQRAGVGARRVALHKAGTMQQAVALAVRLAQPGDVVLLSPGGTSFDAYRDFEARGVCFRQLVNELQPQ